MDSSFEESQKITEGGETAGAALSGGSSSGTSGKGNPEA